MLKLSNSTSHQHRSKRRSKSSSVVRDHLLSRVSLLYGQYLYHAGPPGQVAAVAGKKAGMKQGDVGGILGELGYTGDQVIGLALPTLSASYLEIDSRSTSSDPVRFVHLNLALSFVRRQLDGCQNLIEIWFCVQVAIIQEI